MSPAVKNIGSVFNKMYIFRKIFLGLFGLSLAWQTLSCGVKTQLLDSDQRTHSDFDRLQDPQRRIVVPPPLIQDRKEFERELKKVGLGSETQPDSPSTPAESTSSQPLTQPDRPFAPRDSQPHVSPPSTDSSDSTETEEYRDLYERMEQWAERTKAGLKVGIIDCPSWIPGRCSYEVSYYRDKALEWIGLSPRERKQKMIDGEDFDIAYEEHRLIHGFLSPITNISADAEYMSILEEVYERDIEMDTREDWADHIVANPIYPSLDSDRERVEQWALEALTDFKNNENILSPLFNWNRGDYEEDLRTDKLFLLDWVDKTPRERDLIRMRGIMGYGPRSIHESLHLFESDEKLQDLWRLIEARDISTASQRYAQEVRQWIEAGFDHRENLLKSNDQLMNGVIWSYLPEDLQDQVQQIQENDNNMRRQKVVHWMSLDQIERLEMSKNNQGIRHQIDIVSVPRDLKDELYDMIEEDRSKVYQEQIIAWWVALIRCNTDGEIHCLEDSRRLHRMQENGIRHRLNIADLDEPTQEMLKRIERSDLEADYEDLKRHIRQLNELDFHDREVLRQTNNGNMLHNSHDGDKISFLFHAYQHIPETIDRVISIEDELNEMLKHINTQDHRTKQNMAEESIRRTQEEARRMQELAGFNNHIDVWFALSFQEREAQRLANEGIEHRINRSELPQELKDKLDSMEVQDSQTREQIFRDHISSIMQLTPQQRSKREQDGGDIHQQIDLSRLPRSLRQQVERLKEQDRLALNNLARAEISRRKAMSFEERIALNQSFEDLFDISILEEDLQKEIQELNDNDKRVAENRQRVGDWAAIKTKEDRLREAIEALNNPNLIGYEMARVKLWPVRCYNTKMPKYPYTDPKKPMSMTMMDPNETLKLEIHSHESDEPLLLAGQVSRVNVHVNDHANLYSESNYIEYVSGGQTKTYLLNRLIGLGRSERVHYIKVVPTHQNQSVRLKWTGIDYRYMGHFRIEITNRRSSKDPKDPKKEQSEWSVVNVLPIEWYLRSVVPSEVPGSYTTQAHYIQATLARSYFLNMAQAERKVHTRGWDIDPTQCNQAYSGAGRMREKSDLAVAETKGMIVTYRGKLARTQYYACGRQTTKRGHYPLESPRNIPSNIKCTGYPEKIIDHHGFGLPQVAGNYLTRHGWDNSNANRPTEGAKVPHNIYEQWTWEEVIKYFYQGELPGMKLEDYRSL